MKEVCVLGSTGSIGLQTLSVLKENDNSFSLVGISCHSNADIIYQQTKEFKPRFVAIDIIEKDHPLKDLCSNNNIELIIGENSSSILASKIKADLVLNAIVGTSGLEPTFNIINNGIDLAISNKESLVLAGHIIMPLAKKKNVNIIPVDSEHSAIYQCMIGEKKDSVEKIILTGSGGPFLKRDLSTFKSILPEEALKHPNWDMGKKISIDSATMMNKALELIEAMWLFDISYEEIDIVIHPQSIVHSMVYFKDGSYKAHLGVPDMKVPILYALTFPNRSSSNVGSLDFKSLNLSFEKPESERYPVLGLSEKLIKDGGNRVAVMSIANDYIVQQFLDKKINFEDMFTTLVDTVKRFENDSSPSIEELITLDKNIRLYFNSK
tara:strand:- start:816 stop:1955 length:1140 start_codon:yes stop_codon:yes gene_type:complete